MGLVQITIQPKNHAVPKFDLSIYEVLAPENSPEGFLITTLTAQDKDRGIFGRIHYSFSDMDEPNLFQINSTNGQVRLSSVPDDVSLDREYRESHTLQVVAQGQPTRKGIMAGDEWPIVKACGSLQ